MDTEHMFGLETPLGPVSTPEFDFSKKSRRNFFSMFSLENLPAKRFSRLRPSIILGRRGAGKTAFLYYRIFVDKYDMVSAMHSEKVFLEIAKSLSNLTRSADEKDIVLVENLSEIWQTVLLTSVITHTVK